MPQYNGDRPLLEHIDELRARIMKVLLSIILVSLFVFVFSIKEFAFGDIVVPLPFPDLFNNIASGIIEGIRDLVLPSYVRVILTTPGQAILAQFYTSILIGIIASIPLIFLEVGGFILPGLYDEEKRMVQRMVFPATVLFILGSLLALFFVIPFTMDFLYRYGLALGAETFITIDELISFVVFFVVAFGISFQLPVIMWLISKAGIVDANFWKANWRYVFVGLVIFGAVITPDGSGITMWFVALPMMGLYVLGYLSTRSIVRKERELANSV